jgi:hypothetical protein
MLRTVRDILIGAFIAAMVTSAFAVFGRAPLQYADEAPIDQKWLYGLSGGYNYTFQNAISAAGTTQATATVLPNEVYLMEVDTASGSATGVALPPCVPNSTGGQQIVLYNNTSTGLTVYPAVANNPVTNSQDTINNSTTLSLSGHTQTAFACIKSGVWSSS